MRLAEGGDPAAVEAVREGRAGVQDVLGAHQDGLVAEERIAALADRLEPAIANLLLERERARRERARRAWPNAWKKLEQRGRRAKP